MFRVAAAEVDLEAPIGGPMIGFFARTKPSTGVHDPIMARAVLLDDGDSKAAIVSADLLGLDVQTAEEIRRGIGQAAGDIPASNVLLTCTHTHSGPDCLPVREPNQSWMNQTRTKIVEMVGGLIPALKPSRLSHGRTTVGGVGYNRESAEHPIDEELGAIGIDGEDGKAIATIINYSTHAVVLGASNLQYSADFPGAAADHLRRLRGGVGLFLQGACGDVDPVVYRDRGWDTGTFDDADEIGSRLAEAAVGALAETPAATEVRLRTASKVVDVPLDGPPSREELDEVAAEAEALAETDNEVKQRNGRAFLEWAEKVRQAIRTDRLPRAFPAEIFVLAINDLRLVGLPFETFTDIGLGIKAGLAPLKTFFVGYANGYVGYCPTRWGKDRGKYGGRTSCRYGFGPILTAIGYGADELLVRESVILGKAI